jgi:hypothetical protein
VILPPKVDLLRKKGPLLKEYNLDDEKAMFGGRNFS